MYKEKVLYCEVQFPSIYQMKNNIYPYKYKLEKTLEEYDDIDFIIEDFLIDSFLDVESCFFPEHYEEGIGEYYIDKDTYLSLKKEGQKKYELWDGDKGSYYIPVPIIDIEIEEYDVPTSIHDELALIGMSYRDFA